MSYHIPELSLSHLSTEELEKIKKVIQRQIEFENEIEQSVGGLKKTMCYLINSQENVNNESCENALGAADKMSAKNLSSSCVQGSSKNSHLSALSFNSLNASETCFLCKRSSSSTNLSFRESLIDKLNFLRPATRNNKLVQCSDCSNCVCQCCGNMTSTDFSSQNTDLSNAKWRCKVCIVKRELAKKSGCWSASVEARPDVRRSLLETLKKIKELEKQKKMEQQSSIEFSDIKRVKIKKFGLLAAAASKFNTNLYLRRHSQNSDGENSKIISLDEWRKKRNIENQKTVIGDHDDHDDGDDESKIGKKKFRPFSMNKQEQKSNSESNQMALLTKDLNDFIDRTKSDENLANLAKVILIEHKRSLQMSQTMTQDSSISYNQSTDSRRDSFSSRQDSSISVHENESGKQASTKYGTAQKKNSNDWRQRRKNLMIRSKKWSNAFDEENQDSSLIITTDESFASNSQVENAESQNNSPIFNEDSSCSVHISAPEHSPQFQIRSSFCEDSETLDCENITTRKNTRKLPDLPTTAKSIDISCKLNRSNEDITLNNDNENFLITTSNTSISSLKSLEKSAKKKKMSKRSRNQSLSNETESKLNKNNFSRSIDSIDSLNRSKLKNELAKLTTKSVDFAKLNEKKNSNFIFVNSILPQRSIDYPCIVRKAPKLSDIVRKRLLFQKVSRGATLLGESFSNSIEKDHVPKAPRKIIIRQDNSIEISLSRPPKLRRQNFSEDITTSNFAHQLNNASLVEPSGLKQNPSMLSVSSTNDRRKTIETCENIFIQSEESTKLRARTPPSNPHRILLYKDKSDKSIRTNGLGMILIGGYECEDGTLGCFVTFVIKGGPADLNCIEVGDQILEFNGHSLIDSTYDEVRTYLNNSGDYAQLVVHHNNIRFKIGPNTSPLEVSRHFETVPRLCPSANRKRRNLPPLPTSNLYQEYQTNVFKADPDYVVAETIQVPAGNNLLKPILINHGRLLMQLWNDCEQLKLAITINQVNNLPPRSADEKWYTFVTGRLILDDQDTKVFETKALLNPNGVWNETFVFDYKDSIEDALLEICLHDTQSPDDTRPLRENFIGMIILPLSEANLEDEPRWYELRDKPTRKTSTASVTFKSSSNDSQDSVHESKKKSFNFISSRISRKSARKRSSRQSSERSNESSPSPSLSAGSSKVTPVRRLSRAFARLLSFRRNSESAIKKNIIRFESEDEAHDDQFLSAGRVSRNSQRRHTEMLTRNSLMPPSILVSSRKHSASSSRKSSANDIEEDIDSYFSSETKCGLTPGLGQVSPKSDVKEDAITGDIKLGFLMSKGQLEITVFEAANLVKLTGPSKDTYVKTYLRTGTHRIQKKKTHVVKNATEPVFNSKLSYSACNVLGRRIQVIMVWVKAPKLDKNQCIGEAYVQLDQLDLTQQTIGWYKLYKQHVVDSDFYDSA